MTTAQRDRLVRLAVRAARDASSDADTRLQLERYAAWSTSQRVDLDSADEWRPDPRAVVIDKRDSALVLSLTDEQAAALCARAWAYVTTGKADRWVP